MRLILVNGAPRSGKDTAGEIICRLYPHGRAYQVKLAQQLKERTHRAYGLEGISHSHFEDRKDQPLAEFMGISPRQAYIAMSERFLKPLHGDDVLGRLLNDKLQRWLASGIPIECAVVTDSGFRGEAEVLVRAVGAPSTTLVRLTRPGCAYEGDSRGLIDLSDLGVLCLDVANDGTPSDLERKLRSLPGVAG